MSGSPPWSNRLGLSVTALLIASSAMAQTTTFAGAPAGAIGIEDEIAIAKSRKAAPASITSDATIAIVEKGRLRVVLKGANDWTCLPGVEAAAFASPMCVDRNGVAWLQAWLDHKAPPENRISIGYMMQGESGSLGNPYAKGEKQSADWIVVGPHVMLMGARAMQEGLSSSPSDKAGVDTSKPFVMWAGGPYEHLMIPIGPRAR